jgi:hypothetical protein
MAEAVLRTLAEQHAATPAKASESVLTMVEA